MPTLHMLVGLPYSGKSTFATNLMNKTDALDCLSFDELIEQDELDYNKVFSNPLLVESYTEEFQEKLVDILATGRSFILDQPNVSYYSRKWVMGAAKLVGYSVVAYVFPAQRVDPNRERVVGDRVIEHFKSIYQKPTLDEGFDAVIYMGVSDVVSINENTGELEND